MIMVLYSVAILFLVIGVISILYTNSSITFFKNFLIKGFGLFPLYLYSLE